MSDVLTCRIYKLKWTTLVTFYWTTALSRLYGWTPNTCAFDIVYIFLLWSSKLEMIHTLCHPNIYTIIRPYHLSEVRSSIGAYAGAARCRIYLATILTVSGCPSQARWRVSHAYIPQIGSHLRQPWRVRAIPRHRSTSRKIFIRQNQMDGILRKDSRHIGFSLHGYTPPRNLRKQGLVVRPVEPQNTLPIQTKFGRIWFEFKATRSIWVTFFN